MSTKPRTAPVITEHIASKERQIAKLNQQTQKEMQEIILLEAKLRALRDSVSTRGEYIATLESELLSDQSELAELTGESAPVAPMQEVEILEAIASGSTIHYIVSGWVDAQTGRPAAKGVIPSMVKAGLVFVKDSPFGPATLHLHSNT